jgi:hypothetical protein
VAAQKFSCFFNRFLFKVILVRATMSSQSQPLGESASRKTLIESYPVAADDPLAKLVPAPPPDEAAHQFRGLPAGGQLSATLGMGYPIHRQGLTRAMDLLGAEIRPPGASASGMPDRADGT